MSVHVKISRNAISDSNGVLLNSRFRTRLFQTANVPIFCNLKSLVGNEIVVIDLPQAEGLELKSYDVKKLKTNSYSTFDGNKENILPEGCTIAGDPLHVSFLTIEKLEKLSKNNPASKYDHANIIEYNPFKTHLITSSESLELMNELEVDNMFDESLSNHTYVALSDASDCNHLLFLAHQKNNKFVTNYNAMFLGNAKFVKDELNLMTAQLQMLHMRRSYCRCRFDVLRDVILFQKPANFIPASFVIEAEWGISLPKVRSSKKVIPFENFLTMPPDNARILVKFKPGWLDERVVLTNNIYDLKHLADLASALKAGEIPWNEKDTYQDSEEDDESDFLLQRVAELIENARDKPDIQVVYPFDFADRLWDIIRIVKSIETLKKAFEMIYDELRTGEFRVMVEADKNSSLAKMLRVRNLGNMVFPRLEPLTCLQMLVEIGVDRFKGDIQYRFLKDEFISNVTDLEPFFLHSSAPVEDRIEQLMPLYLALQSILMIEKFVRLTPHKKMLMAKRLLGHFTSVKSVDSNTKEFSFDALMEDIHRDGLKSSMNEWLVERTYEKQLKTDDEDASLGSFNATNNISAIYEIVFLSKFIGFEHVSPVSFDETQNLQNLDYLQLKNEISLNKKRCSDGIGDISNNTGTTGTEPDLEELFDCVYITVTSNSLTPFTNITNSIRSSPTILPS